MTRVNWWHTLFSDTPNHLQHTQPFSPDNLKPVQFVALARRLGQDLSLGCRGSISEFKIYHPVLPVWKIANLYWIYLFKMVIFYQREFPVHFWCGAYQQTTKRSTNRSVASCTPHVSSWKWKTTTVFVPIWGHPGWEVRNIWFKW